MEELTVHSPYDGKQIGKLPWNTEIQAEELLKKAFDLHASKSPLSKEQRIQILHKASQIVQDRTNELAVAASQEGGKPLQDSLIEIQRAAQGIDAAICHLKQMAGREIPMRVSSSSDNRVALTFHEPCGVVFAISAFNHPFNLIVHQVIPAVASGCPVIVKPALSTPFSCLNLVNILYEAGLPPEWCQALVVPDEITGKIAADERLSYVTFIGSAQVGWMIRSRLAPGVECMLEHGGAAAVIVEPDAELSDAIPLLVKGGFYHAGQVCVSVQRIFVHESLCNQFSNEMTERVKRLKVGDPLDKETEVGPLIRPSEVDRIDEWIKEAANGGAKILCGGKKISNTCYSPTILLNPSDNAKVSQNEIFGPVICIYSYKDRLDAIKKANALPFSFQAAVFTSNLNTAFDTVKKLEATAVMVNDHTAFRVDWMPFGGRKHSGLRLGGISETIEAMSPQKLMVIRMKEF